MTDERMDARLRRAGEAWRAAYDPAAPAAQPAPAQPMPLTPAPVRHPRRRAGLLASAAAVAVALAVGAAVLVAGIVRTDEHRQGAATAPLQGTVWRLVASGGDQPRPNSLATLYIGSDDRLVADDGCTLVGAHISAEDGHLYPSAFDVRSRPCTDLGGGLSFADLPDVLASFPTYSVTGAELTISGAGATSRTLHLVAAPELPAPGLDVPTVSGAVWRLANVTDAAGASRPVTGSAELRIDHGQLTAGDTCNTLGGSALVSGGTIELKAVTSTEIGCPEQVMATASVVDAVYSGTVTVRIDGTRLTVSKAGAGTLEYDWVPADPAASDPAGLTGRTWQLVSVAGAPATAEVRLRVGQDGTVTGSDGCQDLSGSAEVGQGAITFHGLPQRPPASCGAADQATTVDSLLAQRPALWAIRDGRLLVFGGGPQAFSLVFAVTGPSPTPPPASPTVAPLLGTTWTLSAITVTSGNSGSGEASSAMADITVRLDTADRITIRHRCYVDRGDVRIGSTTLEISGISLASSVPCPGPGDQRLDSRVDDLLTGTVGWSISDGRLELTKGDTTAQFDR